MSFDKPESLSWQRWQSHCSGQLLRSQNAEIFFAKESGIPIVVMWAEPAEHLPVKSHEDRTWRLRGITDEFHHDLKGWSRPQVCKYLEELLRALKGSGAEI